MPVPPAIEIDGLVKRYDARVVVDHLTLTAQAGAVTAILGPNGAGKTTTVECCEGLRTPDAGTVRVLGLDPVADARILRPRVGVMLQDGGLPMGVRADEVLRHVASLYADPLPLDDLRERLGIASFARTMVRRLSGGQRQRLALACAVVGRPEFVFLDEPSAGMDPQSRGAVHELIHELRADGVGIALTTHLMDEAEDLADHVHILDQGAVVADGPVDELLTGAAGSVTVQAGVGLDVDTLQVRLGPQWTIDADNGTYQLVGPVDPGTLGHIAAWLTATGSIASSIVTGRRTLEDLFLDLTGRGLR